MNPHVLLIKTYGESLVAPQLYGQASQTAKGYFFVNLTEVVSNKKKGDLLSELKRHGFKTYAQIFAKTKLTA